MDKLLSALNGSDSATALRGLIEWGQRGVASKADLGSLLAMAPGIRSRFRATSVVEGARGAITWYAYEKVLWALGEGFRQVLKRNRAMRRSPELFDAIAALCENPAYGKGRESFTMLLGQYGGPSMAPRLVALLADPDVDGHALYALRHLGAPGGRQKALALLAEERGWKRQEARKYLRKLYPDQVAT